MFTEQQDQALAAPLNGDHVKQRQGANRQQLSYLEGWKVIADANRIFDFGNWSRETPQMEALHDPKLVTDVEAPERGKVVAAYFARVRVTRLRQGRRTPDRAGGLRRRPRFRQNGWGGHGAGHQDRRDGRHEACACHIRRPVRPGPL
jgi:recombination DNA repair RAD52 pathway protein